jgi:hypothetical protein
MVERPMLTDAVSDAATATIAVQHAVVAELRVGFDSAERATDFMVALVSMLHGVARDAVVLSGSGSLRDDLASGEIVQRLRKGMVRTVSFVVTLNGRDARIHVQSRDVDAAEVAIHLPVSTLAPVGCLWLQCVPELLAPTRSLRLSTGVGSFTVEATHGLIGLAARCGGFERASLVGFESYEWVRQASSEAAEPLHAALNDAHWSVGSESVAEPVAWFRSGSRPIRPQSPDAGWWTRLDELAAAPRASLPELHQHLGTVFHIPFTWVIDELTQAPPATFTVPPEVGAIARLVPTGDHVVLALDLELPPRVLADMLLHLCAHCQLGHVRPGDPSGHWDTHLAATAEAPHRQWDRDVQALLKAICTRPFERRVTSLAECTPTEKAWLVLHDHISRLVGDARVLHPAAELYQSAAYQRQAAQRLVAQLEDYGGAMLCDGVGLGKTYVATTVLVHYANAWRERLALLGQDASTDPFRITVLAPNSVVSTWQREALAGLTQHGVALAAIRVLSHTRLSRILPSSDVLAPTGSEMSDMEHLLLSDLVIVDEAHNFRSVAARRTVVLRDLLRLQPRKDLRRKVLLLTATPINNGLEDLRQQVSLLLAKPLWLSDKQTSEVYRTHAIREVARRVAASRSSGTGDVSALLIHGEMDAGFSTKLHFRDDLKFGVQIPRVGDYLKEQEKVLQQHLEQVRAAMQDNQPGVRPRIRVAEELLDRIVVQRSRSLCKQIEREQGSNIKLLFRPDAPPPERLVYEDVYDDTRDVLARFLPLFETGAQVDTLSSSLSLKVYMWSDVRDGLRAASETSSVVGLQRVLVLKRLESTPVAFLITLLRLVALHAHRLRQLLELARQLGDRLRAEQLATELNGRLASLDLVSQERLDLLLTGDVVASSPPELLTRWSMAHMSARPAAGADDPLPPQLELLEGDDAERVARRDQFDRLWDLKDDLLRDFGILLGVAPGLADIVFGRFERDDWPRRFIAGGVNIDWPASATWGMRVVTDAKLRRLVARLLRARRDGQKVIVFSQFTDTLAYMDSVLRATRYLERSEWRLALQTLTVDVGGHVTENDVHSLANRTAVVSGETEDRDAVINAFAPFYRLGPARRIVAQTNMFGPDSDPWAQGWLRAMEQPIDVLFASDVLAEGVNLQDASLLVNYDVHWNPVRMIQRAGRVDRRLNPAIEEATSFPELEGLASAHGMPVPRYWWHHHPTAAPITVNLLLPDELETELQLRERIANKTLAIDFTLGLEQGTGAEAEWMADYRYQGISALNVWQKDRAIERVAGYQERLRRLMSARGILADWVANWNGWLREPGVHDDGRILAWAQLGRSGGEFADYTRHLTPKVEAGVAHWLWTTAKPTDSVLNFWLALDGKAFPAVVRTDLGFNEDASRPLSSEDLLAAAVRLVDTEVPLHELGREIGRPVMQGASAISAGYLGAEPDRRTIQVKGFRILQLALGEGPEPTAEQVERRGLARPCQVCGHPPAMHKCCPACGVTADGDVDVEATFGFRRLHSADGESYDVPQTWCRACRKRHARLVPPSQEESC